MLLEEIKKELFKIPDIKIKNVFDNSIKHSGHTSVVNSNTKLTHIEVLLSVNKSKSNKLEIHRSIYEKLDCFINQGLHSIEIKITK